MADATLTVPAEYAEDFRAALVYELAEEAGYVKNERKKLRKARYLDREHASDDGLRMAMGLLERDVALCAQVGFLEDTGAIEIPVEGVRDDLGTLGHVCETVARKIIGPRLAEALDCGPFDEKAAVELRELMERLAWAIDRAAEVNAGYFPEPDREEVTH